MGWTRRDEADRHSGARATGASLMMVLFRSDVVIPAQAGIHERHTIRSRFKSGGGAWIPACAGMTDETLNVVFVKLVRVRARRNPSAPLSLSSANHKEQERAP